MIADLTVLHKGTEIGGDISQEKESYASHVRRSKRKHHNSAGRYEKATYVMHHLNAPHIGFDAPPKRLALNQPSSPKPISRNQKHSTQQSCSDQFSLSTRIIIPICSLNPYQSK